MKLDAPSGTADMLLAGDRGRKIIRQRNMEEKELAKRGDEIGIHSVRGGTIAGEHTVLFRRGG